MGGGENDGILIKCIKPNGVPQHILREGSERRTKITRFCDRAHFCGKPPKTIEETTGVRKVLRDNCFSGRPARNPANQRGYRIFRNGSKTRKFSLSRGLRTQSRAGFNRGSATFPKEPRVRYNGPEKNTETQMVLSRFPAGGGLPQDMLYVPWNSSPPGFPHPPPPRVRFLAWNSSPPGLRHPPLQRRDFWPGILPHLGSRTPPLPG